MTFTPSLPLRIRRIAGGYRLSDAGGRTLAVTYCREPPETARAAKVLTFPEGLALVRRLARLLTDDQAASPGTPGGSTAAGSGTGG